MNNKIYEDVKDIIDHDADIMDVSVKTAWFGYLSALSNELLITVSEYQELAAKLGIKQDERNRLYDALSGGITTRE